MASATLLRFARKRPWISLGTATTGVTVASAFGLESYANFKERQEVQSFHSPNENGTCQVSGASENPAGSSLPRAYDRQQIRNYWLHRPVSVFSRVVHVAVELLPVALRYCSDRWMDQLDAERQQFHACELRDALTTLGPAFVKGGQQLAIRPDLVPPVVLKELQKLCDSVKPIPDELALQLLKEETGVEDLSSIFQDLHLVASASLGQVYQARLVKTKGGTEKRGLFGRRMSGKDTAEGQLVAIKVQRPGMRKSFSLDLFLLQQWGEFMDGFTSIFTQQVPYHRAFIDAFAAGSYSELDYLNEARNQKHFQNEFRKRGCKVKVPDVYDEYSTERILTTEWIQGVKLADSSKEKIRELIPVGVELFLTQLLDIGAFHSDPHPGNLLVTEDEGILCLLDFGLTADVDPQARIAMTNAIVNLLYRDFDALISKDAKELGFLPRDFDVTELKPLLTKVLTGGVLESSSDLRNRRRKLQEISNELNEIFFRYPFQVPPFFALVTRGLGLLEGIALTGDPDFDIFRASAPYATRRAFGIMGRSMTSPQRRGTSMARC